MSRPLGQLLTISLALSLPAFAQDQGGPGHGPPPEAVKACASLAANASCSFTLGSQTVNGTCDTPPGGTTLACRPSGPPPGGPPHHGPPPEALKACSGLSVNATCAFSHGATNLTGTCVAPPDGATGELACRPDRMPEPR